MTIYEKALEFIHSGDVVGLGSGKASTEFIKLLGQRVQEGRLQVKGVPTSDKSGDLATQLGIPLVSLREGMPLAVAVDGADEVDPDLNMIKGWGRALVREKIVEAAARRFVVLVDESKLVPHLGARPASDTERRGKLPVEVIPLALPLAEVRLREIATDLGFALEPVLWAEHRQPARTDNGNYILDCLVDRVNRPAEFEARALAIPGVVGTGLFLGMADLVLVGDAHFNLIKELRRR